MSSQYEDNLKKMWPKKKEETKPCKCQQCKSPMTKSEYKKNQGLCRICVDTIQ
jgi:uncharacterized CHY-type Zn-finger protein